METGNVHGISVLEPIAHAINKTKHILFDPFNLEKWFVIGFCAWLAALGSGGGGGGNYNFNFSSDSPHSALDINQLGQEVSAFLAQALPWLIPVAIVIIVFGVAIALLVIWLKSRGQFMFLDCIVHNRGAIAAPWKSFRNEANSLFAFKLIVGLASFTLILAAVIPLVTILYSFAKTDFKVLLVGPMVGAGFLLLGLCIVALLHSLITVLTDDFVVPVMMLRRCGVVAAWQECLGLFSSRAGMFILYLLVLLLINLVLGLASFFVVITACCCFCCVSWVLVIPIVGTYLITVLLLPLVVWRRSYAVLFLAQFGAGYNVFVLAQPPVPPTAEVIDSPPADPGEPTAPTDPDSPQTPEEG